MRILFVGEIYSSNLGDRILYEATRSIFFKLYPDAEFAEIDIMMRKSVDAAMAYKDANIKSRVRKGLSYIPMINVFLDKRSTLKNYADYEKIISKGYDLAVFVGGQIVKPIFMIKVKAIVGLLKKYNIPVVFNAIDIGKFNKKDAQIYTDIFESDNVRGISCRCNKERFIKNFPNVRKEVISTFDSALFCSEIYLTEHNEPGTEIGLGVMLASHFSERQVINFWGEIINGLNNQKKNWKIFTTGTYGDEKLALKIIKLLGLPKDKILPRPLTPKEMTDQINSFKKILSFRLHSHIIAYSYGIPTIAISWDKKVDDFFEKIGKKDCVFSINADTEDIISMLNRLEADPEQKEHNKENKKIIISNIKKLVGQQ